MYVNGAEAENLQEKALLVFDLISRTLYRSLFAHEEEKGG